MKLFQSRVKILYILFWSLIYFINPYGLFDLIFFEIKNKCRYLWRVREKNLADKTRRSYLLPLLSEFVELVILTLILFTILNFLYYRVSHKHLHQHLIDL